MIKKTILEFIKELVEQFPEISSEVLDDDYDGLISLQIGCFTKYTQEAINGNKRPVVLKCFRFVEEWIDEIDFKVENSLAINWVARLNFDNDDGNLYFLMSPKLKEIRKGLLDAYNKSSNKQ